MRITDSSDVLKEKGYTVITKVEPKISPEYEKITFAEMFPELKNTEEEFIKRISDKPIFSHQLKAMKALEEGKNIIIKSGTGSGKTEAWALYALKKASTHENFRTIAIYPTLALSNDQVSRIEAYSKAFSVPVMQLDSPSKEAYRKEHGTLSLRKKIISSKILITNPAFLLTDLKKFFTKQNTSIFQDFYFNPGLIVIDELDFYDPRSISLILGILELISKVSQRKPQVAILTATLSNPTELGVYLKTITDRDFEIIEGKPFHVENRLCVVLGKDLEKIWNQLKEYEGSLSSRKDVDKSILDSLKDLNSFKKNPYKTLEYLEALGYNVPSIEFDITDILSLYLQDDGLTIVFTSGINRAEEIARKLKIKVGEDKVATHHHLVSKSERKKIEDWAKEGKIKIIVSPRTLSQGIDIGSVVRIVHIGLPDSLREFLQREGRKGRREEIPFTESIIIPHNHWDRELFAKGYEAFENWVSLPVEKTIINPKNLYMKLFTGIVKLVSPWLRQDLTEPEIEALKRAKILTDGQVNKSRLKFIWDRLNFYELGPPYGIKRYLESDSEKIPLEPIGFCDLVEIFQLGCFDHANDAIVVYHQMSEKYRSVTSVIEKKIKDVNFWQDEGLARAIEEYLDTKARWGEDANFYNDIRSGRLFSRVEPVVYPPRNGFGMLTKIPDTIMWLVSSKKPSIFKVGNSTIVDRKKRAIVVPVEVHGMYRDFTYGYIYEVDERLDLRMLRIALAFISVALRRIESIHLGLIEYGISNVSEKKFIEVHESASAGFLDSFDWLEFAEKVRRYEPDTLDLIMMDQVDEIAYADFLAFGMGWEDVKSYAQKVLEYLDQGRHIELSVKNFAARITKPSKSLKLLSIDALLEPIEDQSSEAPLFYVLGLTYFDGENLEGETRVDMISFGLPPGAMLKKIESEIDDLAEYEEYNILISSKEVAKSISTMGLRKLPKMIESKGIEVMKLLENVMQPPSLEPYIMLGKRLYGKLIGKEADLADIEEINMIIKRMKSQGYKQLLDSEKKKIESYIKIRAVAIYLAYLHYLSLEREKKTIKEEGKK
ncbi:DEAD/DEAH box helicase [Fervidicoccus fontis]|uniref:DEAD/DEAH box helicase domain protein n=1 Tax=Fervidicoccus fontis (strain DSM 19380 / JCM 18336 / VKM B-2539 / Kam940) TaxID=1163730 RepID=H9ZZM4_FERFK|nr:DEAD/DEAH box helicase [Fervidicoccus fontis]AFH42181.1 DEAD/DEAH box helicase domain protein [Fervidicoccus fontis Kam940]